MALSSFAIQFRFMASDGNGNVVRIKRHTYEASITMLSNTFSLFEVTAVKRITKTKSIRLPGAYYITSYPMRFNEKETWKDAVTMNADEFLQAIGDAIENHLRTPQPILSHYLN